MARQRYVVVTTTPTGVATSDPMLKGPALESALSACEDWRAQKTTHSVVGTKGESEFGGPVVIGRGSWYVVALVNSYIFNLMGMAVLVWFAVQRDLYRMQTVALLAAVLIPILVNVFYQAAPVLLPALSVRIDLTPISFTISAALIAIGVFGLRIFDLMPIARYTVMEHIPEMVFVVDAHDRVLDANPVAQQILNKRMDEIIGKDPLEVFRDWPQLLNRYLTAGEVHEEIELPGEPPRTVELVISPLHNRFNALEGRVIVAHDITEQKWLQKNLQSANDTLKVQLAEIEALRAKLQEQAIRDPLTNVYNRRYMAEFLTTGSSRSRKREQMLSPAAE